MVRAISVVLDTTTELRERQDQDVFVLVVLLHVRVEVVDSTRNIGQQLLLQSDTVGVCVETTVLCVADPSPDIGLQNLGCALHALREEIRIVLDVRVVCQSALAQHVRAAQGVQTRLAEQVHRRSAAQSHRVDVLEHIQHFRPLYIRPQVSHQSVCLQVCHRCDWSTFSDKRSRQAAAKVDRSNDIVALRMHLPDRISQPTFISNVSRFGGVPDVHRSEVRSVRLRVTHPMDDRDLALVPQLFDGLHTGVEAVLPVHRQYTILRDPNVRAIVDVSRIVVGHDAIEVVVTA